MRGRATGRLDAVKLRLTGHVARNFGLKTYFSLRTHDGARREVLATSNQHCFSFLNPS